MTTNLVLVAVDAVAWVVISVLWGTLASALPKRAIDHDTWWSRQRSWEPAMYRAIRIRRWKDALPESNRLGGERLSKRHLPAADRLEEFIGETRRAEYVHLAIGLSGPLFALWNPAWLAVVMVVFGFGFNLPFIAIQRFNRFRLQRVVARRGATGEQA